MKNKKLIYILIPLVILIWGLVIFKIFEQIRPKEDYSWITKTPQFEKKEQGRDRFTIVADYRDPFLNGTFRTKEYSEPDIFEEYTTGGFSKKKEPVAEEKIPDLKYFGVIVSSKNKKKVGIFRLKEKDLILQEGEAIQEFKIVRLYNDSVKTIFKKNKKISIMKMLATNSSGL